jgi:ribosomal protein S18 acetylase RimI-like enzyme
VGFVLPVAGVGFGTIGHLGVVPAARGRRIVDALVQEGVLALRAAGLTRILADTDHANVAMARAFTRNGWTPLGERREWSRALAAPVPVPLR